MHILTRLPQSAWTWMLMVVLCSCRGTAPDRAPDGMLPAPDGVAIAFEDRAADEPAPGRPALVLIHGWACDRAFWGELPERLGSDHRVVTLDLPGHGQSGRVREHWDVVDLGADVAAVCDQLELDDLVLVGHSMGATVALAAAGRLAAEGPGRVRGVIAIDSLHEMVGPVPAEMIENFAALFEADWTAAMEAAVGSMVPAGPDAKLTRWIVARALGTDQEAAVALMRSFAGLELVDLALAAGVPVRAVNAAPYSGGAETLTEANRAALDFDAVLVEGVGHYLQLERPAEVERGIRGFLDEFARAALNTHPTPESSTPVDSGLAR